MAAETDNGTSGPHASIAQRRRVVAQSLRIGNPANKASDLPAQAEPRHDCQVELNVDEICPYEKNPRRAPNAKFAQIKESIRSSGIRNPLTVTRRPGEQNFIVEAGGNTRLAAVQELWAETHESRFQKITVLFRPWRSESHVLTAHLIENEQRGEMTFWDKANGVVALKAQLEVEQERTLSLKHLEAELKRIGMSVNTATLSHYLFATERLRILGEAVMGLSGLDVKTMQPRLNALKRYAQLRVPIEETALYEIVFGPVFQEVAKHYGQTLVFSASAVCDACEGAVAGYLHEPVTQVRMALDALVQPRRDASAASLLDACKHETLPRVQVAPAAAEPPDRNRAVDTPGTAVANSETGHAPYDGAVHPTDEERARRLTEEVLRFAHLVGIGDCLRLHPAAPYGYFVQALPSRDEEDSPQRLRHRAWWLLALISGQLENSSQIPPSEDSCAAQSAAAADVNCGENESLKTILPDDGFVPWLLDSQDEAAGAFWQIVTHVRELRSSIARANALAGTRTEMKRTA